MKISNYYLLLTVYFTLIVAIIYHHYEWVAEYSKNIEMCEKALKRGRQSISGYSVGVKTYSKSELLAYLDYAPPRLNKHLYIIRPLLVLPAILLTFYLVRNYPRHKGA